jgi:hypothetical protein
MNRSQPTEVMMQRSQFNFSNRGPVTVEAPTMKGLYEKVVAEVGSDFANLTYVRDLVPAKPLVQLG